MSSEARSDSKRILFWSGTFLPHVGGVEVLAAKFLPAMRDRGYEFLVITPLHDPSHPAVSDFEGIQVLRFPLWDREHYTDVARLATLRRRLTKVVEEFSPDLVHINAVGVSDFFYHLISDARSVPLLVTLHGKWDLTEGGRNPIVERTLRAAEWTAGCSAAIVDFAAQFVPSVASRSSVIHNGMDCPVTPPAPLVASPPRLLCLGRLSKEKGFDLAISALPMIVQRFPDVRLFIAGEGQEAAELRQQCLDAGVQDSVDFLGSVDPASVPSLINDSSMLLMPSREDSLPMVALEAAMMERPVVGARVGGMPEVVADQATGVLVAPDDFESLASATIDLLAEPSRMSRLGKAARVRALERFTWKRHLHAYEILYQRLIGGSATASSTSAADGKN